VSIECPGCGAKSNLTFRECLEPYSMSFSIRPEEGRAVQAKTAAGTLSAFHDLMASIGAELGHESLVHLIAARVDDDLSVHFTVSVNPFIRAPDQSGGLE